MYNEKESYNFKFSFSQYNNKNNKLFYQKQKGQFIIINLKFVNILSNSFYL